MIDRDRLNGASTGEVAQGVVLIADAVQKLPKHVRVLASAGFLALMADQFDIAPQDVMTALGNLRADAERTGRVEFRAIETYFREDL